MKLIIILYIASTTLAGIIQQETHHDKQATSYQNVHMEHSHDVPTFIKKEHAKLLEHPISIGASGHKLKVHHGNKHDPGHAIGQVMQLKTEHHLGLENDSPSFEGPGDNQEYQAHYLEDQGGYNVHDETTNDVPEEYYQQFRQPYHEKRAAKPVQHKKRTVAPGVAPSKNPPVGLGSYRTKH